MRSKLYNLIGTIILGSSLVGCSVHTEKKIPNNIEKVVATSTVTATLEPTEIPATPLPRDILWMQENDFPLDSFNGFSEEQINTYLSMSYDELIALKHLFLLDEDIFQERLTPSSVFALSNYVGQFDIDIQNSILQAPSSPLEFIGSTAHIMGLSDDASLYHLALPWDMLEEYFGMDVLTVFNNTEENTLLYIKIEDEYTDESERIFRLGSTVEDRVQEIRDQSPLIARNYSLDQVLDTVIEKEKDNEGPVTLYFVPHMHLGKSKVIFDNFYEKKWYNVEQMFPEEFLKEFDGRHLNLIFSTCTADFVDKLKSHLDKNNRSYTLLYGDNSRNSLQEMSLQGFAKATEIVVNTKYLTGQEQNFPAVTFNDLQQVADGTLEGAKIRESGDYLYYTIRPLENYDPFTREHLDDSVPWPAEIEIYLRVEPGTHEYSSANLDFEVAIISSDNIKDFVEYIPLFGMNLERME